MCIVATIVICSQITSPLRHGVHARKYEATCRAVPPVTPIAPTAPIAPVAPTAPVAPAAIPRWSLSKLDRT